MSEAEDIEGDLSRLRRRIDLVERERDLYLNKYGELETKIATGDFYRAYLEKSEQQAAELAALTADRDRLAGELAQAQNTISDLTPVTLRYQEVIQYTLSQMEYLQLLWGKEGVSDNVVERLREALHPEQPK
jgi:hypothetical protein